MTPEAIERTLADFRDWLTADAAGGTPTVASVESIDLHTLVGHFTALRQDVNLQTKATRAATEQNAETLKLLDEAVEALRQPAEVAEPEPVATMSPLLKTLIDVYDSLALANRQIEKQQSGFHNQIAALNETLVVEMPPVVIPESGEKPSFWRKFFGNDEPPAETSPLIDWHRQATKKLADRQQTVHETCDFLRDALAGVMTGYAMGMHRIDRMLTAQGLETIRCVGQRFDPEMMEVVEAVSIAGRQLGDVIEEIRRGYTLNGTVVRFAQVRVAR